jgi:hypothetical protein
MTVSVDKLRESKLLKTYRSDKCLRGGKITAIDTLKEHSRWTLSACQQRVSISSWVVLGVVVELRE